MSRYRHEYTDLLTARRRIALPRPVRSLMWMILVFLTIVINALIFVPWIQTAEGMGTITAFHPDGQLQEIHALVPGRIKRWYVHDGSPVRKGDVLVEIMDNDPRLIERLEAERDAVSAAFEASRIAIETAEIDYHRKDELFREGLSSRRDFEQAKIKFKSWKAKVAEAASKLASAETKLSRQHTQLVRAPQDGIVVNTLAGDSSTLVKEGDVITTFVPTNNKIAVELYVNGLDLPLIQPGREVRLQFEGWPIIQFSGWPSVAIGTFTGVVSVVDPSISPNGKFRILVTEKKGHQWPDRHYLRFGAQAHGWVLMNEVSLGYELWRQMNGFPPQNTVVK